MPFASAAQVMLPAGSVIHLPCGTNKPPGPGARITEVKVIKTRSDRPVPENRGWEHFCHTLIIGRDISTVRF